MIRYKEFSTAKFHGIQKKKQLIPQPWVIIGALTSNHHGAYWSGCPHANATSSSGLGFAIYVGSGCPVCPTMLEGSHEKVGEGYLTGQNCRVGSLVSWKCISPATGYFLNSWELMDGSNNMCSHIPNITMFLGNQMLLKYVPCFHHRNLAMGDVPL